jgi:hypothetical protein
LIGGSPLARGKQSLARKSLAVISAYTEIDCSLVGFIKFCPSLLFTVILMLIDVQASFLYQWGEIENMLYF